VYLSFFKGLAHLVGRFRHSILEQSRKAPGETEIRTKVIAILPPQVNWERIEDAAALTFSRIFEIHSSENGAFLPF
jgi:hypothetical protein